jgi:hypothetical protein
MNGTRKPSKLKEIADSELDAVSGGKRLATIHPTKVIVPEIKFAVSYS